MTTEVHVQLDGNGRTTWVKDDQKDSGGKADDAVSVDIDHTTKTVMTLLAPSPSLEDARAQDHDTWRAWMDKLLFDCEIADCGLMPRTFWMPVDGTEPRCALEQMALDVFRHHVPEGFPCDLSTSGAEWWVQLRPSPPVTGRYSMHDPDHDDDEMTKTGISFHWDKDEDLRILAGGSLYVHPHLSTVTYLTDFGAPTMVLNCRVNNTTGDWIVPGTAQDSAESVQGFVSWPKQGKHLAFDGRFLHAAPPDLMEANMFEEQCRIPNVGDGSSDAHDAKSSDRELKILERRHRRVTFLVNIWLNYRPFNVNPFPDTMIDKLTKTNECAYKNLFALDSRVEGARRVTIHNNTLLQDEQKHSNDDEQTKDFTWPMGDCDSNEVIRARMPLLTIQREACRSGNVEVNWEKPFGGVCLSKTPKPTAVVERETDQKESVDTSVTSPPSKAKRIRIDHDD